VANPASYDEASLSPAEQEFLQAMNTWSADEGSYQHQQRTKPVTLAYALNDSPVGLLAWILEKYRAWSDSHGDVSSRFSDEFLLTQASLYWFTGSISTSFRPYYESGNGITPAITRVDVPTAVALFPGDIAHPPRSFAERTYRVERFTEFDRGGHFAPHEEPDLLADDLREFFRPLR
jgi:pimeloyl-ACP methyl ester carboxylesterase